MGRPSRFSPEVRERAVRMVEEHREAVEFATLTWVDWFNTRRLLGPLGDIPPAEFEAQYYEQAEVA